MYPSMDKNLRQVLEENNDIPKTMEEIMEKTKEMRQRVDEMSQCMHTTWSVDLDEQIFIHAIICNVRKNNRIQY